MRIFLIILILIFPKQSFGNCDKAANVSRVVAAGGSLTEIIYYLGHQKYLVARDLTSNFPPEAKKLPSIGYVRNLSAEGLLSLSPSLILSEADAGPPHVIEQVKRTAVDFRVIKDDYDSKSILNKISCIGKILGTDERDIELKFRYLNEKIEQLRSVSSEGTEIKSVLVILMMRGTSPIIAGADTSGDGFIQMTGNINAFADFSGWKPVGIENILDNNPDAIIITKRGFSGFKSLEDFLVKSGLIATKAGKKGSVFIEDGMAMLGFGPRTLDVALNLKKAIQNY